jgi:transcriptional regulator with XRE-family HTH domain
MKLRDRQPASTRQGVVIRERLETIGMSMNELARQLEVSPSFMSRVLSGQKRLTTPERIEQAAGIIGIRSDELYLAIDTLPPDVAHAIQRHPQMLSIIRQAAAKLDERKRT